MSSATTTATVAAVTKIRDPGAWRNKGMQLEGKFVVFNDGKYCVVGTSQRIKVGQTYNVTVARSQNEVYITATGD